MGYQNSNQIRTRFVNTWMKLILSIPKTENFNGSESNTNVYPNATPKSSADFITHTIDSLKSKDGHKLSTHQFSGICYFAWLVQVVWLAFVLCLFESSTRRKKLILSNYLTWLVTCQIKYLSIKYLITCKYLNLKSIKHILFTWKEVFSTSNHYFNE